MKNIIVNFALAAVLLAMVLTFGHAAANSKYCQFALSGNNQCNSLEKSIIGGTAAVFFPFYWSWELFEK